MSIAFSELPLKRTCEYCGNYLEGRSDRRFCDKKCGSRFDKEEQHYLALFETLGDAIKQKVAASREADLHELRKAQLAIQRSACAINEILERRATVNPSVERSVLVTWRNGILSNLFDWNETSAGYPSFDDQLDAYIESEFTNPFAGER